MVPTFEEVYGEYRTRVARLCASVTGNTAAAEDATQEAFLAIHRALGTFRGEAKLSTWIYRIALHAALKARSGTHGPHVPPDEAQQPELAVTGTEEALQAREQMRQVAAAMDRLGAGPRVVLSLFAIDGLGHAEIAEVLGIPEGTVWSRLHAARKQLAAQVQR